MERWALASRGLEHPPFSSTPLVKLSQNNTLISTTFLKSTTLLRQLTHLNAPLGNQCLRRSQGPSQTKFKKISLQQAKIYLQVPRIQRLCTSKKKRHATQLVTWHQVLSQSQRQKLKMTISKMIKNNRHQRCKLRIKVQYQAALIRMKPHSPSSVSESRVIEPAELEVSKTLTLLKD